jgi:hypothetical protein
VFPWMSAPISIVHPTRSGLTCQGKYWFYLNISQGECMLRVGEPQKIEP